MPTIVTITGSGTSMVAPGRAGAVDVPELSIAEDLHTTTIDPQGET